MTHKQLIKQMKKAAPAADASASSKASARKQEATPTSSARDALIRTHSSSSCSSDEEVNDTASTMTINESARRKIPSNPSAGDVHRRERGMPWRIEFESSIQQANAKALEEQWDKRKWGLAKQIQDGLMHNYQINYGVSELANLIKEGMVLKRSTSEATSSLTPHQVAYVQFLVAVEKYDLKQIVVLLEKFPKGR